jgi:hypothetical protein
MRHSLRRLAVQLTIALSIGAAVIACGATASGTARPRVDNTRMDTTELRGHGYGSVYDAVSARHADWLQARGGTTDGVRAPVVGVFIEGSTRPYELSYLKEVRPEEIRMVRRLSPSESLQTYSWPWGAIVITR